MSEAQGEGQISARVDPKVRRLIQAALQPTKGPTTERPPGLGTGDSGYQFYDTTLSKPIWWSGSAWKDAAGTTV